MRKADRNISYETKKPNHVRRLNFGQSILTLNVVEQFQGQKDGVLLIEKNVADIPYIEKGDFVHKWIETHVNYAFDSKETSSVVDHTSVTTDHQSSITDSARTSPIFGNQCASKFIREKVKLENNGINNIENIHSNDSQNTCIKESGSGKRMRMDSNDKKKNIRRKLFDSQPITVPYESSDANVSPILVKNSYSYKRSRRKYEEENAQRKALDSIENKYVTNDTTSPLIHTKIYRVKKSPILIKNSYKRRRTEQKKKIQEIENKYINSDINSMDSCNSIEVPLKKKWEILNSQKKRALLKKLEDGFEASHLNHSEKDLESAESCSSMYKKVLNIEDSPKEIKDVVKIEIETSEDEDNDSINNTVHISNDTDNDSSIRDNIEDTDTDYINKNRNLAFPISKYTSVNSQISDKDSDVTFFLKEEQLSHKFVNERSSQKISQFSTQVTNVTDNISSQTGIIINTKTPPQETLADASVQLTVLDSCKKRRKPKKGSLLEKLQSTINRQVSFVRIWRHQLKQTIQQNTSMPCITVYVQTCITRFGRQFLNGFVIEDPLDLFSHKKENNSVKFINIMTIPEIVGRIEMKSKGLVQIFPPWEILDEKESIFHVTYIRVVPDNEIDIKKYKINLNQFKKSVTKEFHCACIDKNTMISTCEDRFNKPNIIEKLFMES